MMLGLILVQGIGRSSYMMLRVRQVLIAKKSKYQEIIVADVEDFGRCLVLDGYVQSCENDEKIYHEMLAHPAMIVHPHPGKVLIIGGGEGATLREVLRHNTVRKAVMVDIDGDVVSIAKDFLPKMHENAFNDPRAEVVITDGLEYLKAVDDRYDVIILDLTDPYSSEIAKQLYEEEFYRLVNNRLNEDGVMVTQAGSRYFYKDVYESVVSAIRNVFPYYLEYQVWIPSFGYACNFVLASKNLNPREYLRKEYIDKALRDRSVQTAFVNGLRVESIVNQGVY